MAIAKRGFRRIEKLWDENAVPEARAESLSAATLDKHDAIIRRNLGMNETPAGSCSLNLHVLTGGPHDNQRSAVDRPEWWGRAREDYFSSCPAR